MTLSVERKLDELGWRSSCRTLLSKMQAVQVRQLLSYMADRDVELEEVDWDDFIRRRFAGARSAAAVRNAVRDLEIALETLGGGDWRHIGDGRVRRQPLPRAEDVVPMPWRSTVRRLDSRGRGAVLALLDVVDAAEQIDIVLTDRLLEQALDRRRRSIEPGEGWGPARRRAFGQDLYRALHRLDPTMDLEAIRQKFLLASNLNAVAHLPLTRWPRPMQVRGLDIDTDAEQIIGRYLLHLSHSGRPLETVNQDALVDYVEATARSNTTAIRRLEQLALHLPTVVPGCEAVCREAVRTIMARRYAEYTAHYDRDRRDHRPRRRGWRLALPRDSWPAAWRAAFDAFEHRCRSDDVGSDLRQALLGGDGAPRQRVAFTSLEQMERTVGELLHAARSDGRLEVPDVLSPDSVQIYLDTQRARGCRPATLSIRVKWLHTFAEKVLGWPYDQRRWLSLTSGNLSNEGGKDGRRKLARRLPSLSEVWKAGEDLWQLANGSSRNNMTAFRKARDGLLICLSCNAPARANELATLRFGKELKRTEEGWYLQFVQKKTGKTYRNSKLWPEVGAMLDVYVNDWLANAADGDWVWMSHRPSDRWVRSVFEHRLGINPHAIRDTVATAFTLHGIDRAQAIPSILGHGDPRTADAYIRASRILSAAEKARALLSPQCDLDVYRRPRS